MKRILWLSQAKATKPEEEALREHFGECQIIHVPQRFTSIRHLVDFYRRGSYDELVYLGGIGLIHEMMKYKLFPLRPMMVPSHPHERGAIQVRGRFRKFIKWQRWKGIEFKLDDLEQEA